jgi:hypothetical protein
LIWYNVSREIAVDMYDHGVTKAQTLNVKEKRLQFLKLVDPVLDLCLGSAFLPGAWNPRNTESVIRTFHGLLTSNPVGAWWLLDCPRNEPVMR